MTSQSLNIRGTHMKFTVLAITAATALSACGPSPQVAQYPPQQQYVQPQVVQPVIVQQSGAADAALGVAAGMMIGSSMANRGGTTVIQSTPAPVQHTTIIRNTTVTNSVTPTPSAPPSAVAKSAPAPSPVASAAPSRPAPSLSFSSSSSSSRRR
jgi:hypothetical protein